METDWVKRDFGSGLLGSVRLIESLSIPQVHVFNITGVAFSRSQSWDSDFEKALDL